MIVRIWRRCFHVTGFVSCSSATLKHTSAPVQLFRAPQITAYPWVMNARRAHTKQGVREKSSVLSRRSPEERAAWDALMFLQRLPAVSPSLCILHMHSGEVIVFHLLDFPRRACPMRVTRHGEPSLPLSCESKLPSWLRALSACSDLSGQTWQQNRVKGRTNEETCEVIGRGEDWSGRRWSRM